MYIYLIQTNIIKLDNGRTWIMPQHLLLGRWPCKLFTHIGGWIHHKTLVYGYTSISCAATQFDMVGGTSSHDIEIVVDKYACTPLEERICELRHHGVESDDIMFATILFVIELRRRYHCFFKGHFNALKIQYLLYKVEA